MTPLTASLLGFAGLFVLIGLRMPIGLALALVGLAGVWGLHGLDTMLFVLGSAPIESLSSHTLSVLPLFILMGSFAVRSGLSESLYRAAFGFFGHRRGGLAVASVVACGGFGAVCGSSVAAAATMTRLCVPEMLRYGYSPKLAAGSIAAGGTLAILIPPSLLMIVYAFLTETSIGQLFAAGIVPGIIATALYAAAIGVLTLMRPEMGPAGERTEWTGRLRLLAEIWPVALLFALVMGGIFFGLFTPTEGAAVGAAGALALGIAQGRIGWRTFVECLEETLQLSAMLLFIVVGVAFFNFFMEAAQVPQTLAAVIGELALPPPVVMAIIVAFLIALGCVMDSIAIVFITTPFLFPIVSAMGYDAVWFGIVMVMIVEFGLITPPFGMNVFVLAKMVPETTVWGVFEGVTPFICADFVRLGVLMAFPGIALWLPRLLFQ